MKNITLTTLAFFLLFSVNAQRPQLGGFGSYQPKSTECVPPLERTRINQMLKENIIQLKAEGKLAQNWGTETDEKLKPTAGNFI